MGGRYTLDRVRKRYSFWGNHPGLYTAQDLVTFLGRARIIRGGAVKRLGLKRGDRALEVACGTGRNFPYLIDAIGSEGTLMGFDYTQEMLDAAEQLCRRRGWKNVRLVQGDAARLDIGEEGFDGVLSVLGLSAVPDYVSAIRRCKEVLRPGGVMSVCDGRPFEGPPKVLNPLLKAVYTRSAVWDPSKDVAGEMGEVFGNVETESFNSGSFFIARSVKEAA